ncbi:hypothetical protein FJT64_007651 [Amphibalanus amphitrite]|uniref:Protein tweety homolog n=1 Tax=Amphibalanus amphitrite TaxID=1232801 RepID=A0A6A4VEB7_AMPAM|nr:hypothetical protein FJT64_007651 [Amphibalanus amphitrite]
MAGPGRLLGAALLAALISNAWAATLETALSVRGGTSTDLIEQIQQQVQLMDERLAALSEALTTISTEFTPTTLAALQESNDELGSALGCADSGQLSLTGPQVAQLTDMADNTRAHVAPAEVVIDDILDPRSGLALSWPFMVVLMTLGCLLVLGAVVALAVIGVRASRRPGAPAARRPARSPVGGRDNAAFGDLELAERPLGDCPIVEAHNYACTGTRPSARDS